MKVLLDENLPHALRTAIQGHEVETARYRGWSGLKNGNLLAAAEEGGVDVLVTGDQSISYQQSFEGRKISLIVLSALNWPIIKNYLPTIQAAIDSAGPGTFQSVDCGIFSRKGDSRTNGTD